MNASTREAAVFWGSIDFDNGTWDLTYNGIQSDGSTISGNDDGTYSMDPDGRFTFTPSVGEPTFYGQLSADGNVLVMTVGEEKTNSYRHNHFCVAVKNTGHPFTAADLSGTYHYSVLNVYDIEAAVDEDRDASVSWGAITFDGTGTFTSSFDEFDDDAVIESHTSGGTYTVDSGGSVQLSVTTRIYISMILPTHHDGHAVWA